jgi:iron complex outermembrane receptor protein
MIMAMRILIDHAPTNARHGSYPGPVKYGCLRRKALIRGIWCAALIWGPIHGGWAQGPESSGRTAADLANLGLEDLMNIEITSVSKRPERISEAAAAVYVITQEDIRRSGVTSLPDALRLAPNLQVARASASGYAISARGFNSSSANKLLVLIDGRSVYTPLFSGVFWDVQDVVLEDVERIEVISGPGGTLWGVNAVNGIVNVITRSAKNTQGGLAAVGVGSRENDVALRYGDTVGADGRYRVYGKYFDRNHTFTADGTTKDDTWHKGQAGFRADWDRPGDQFMVQANAYRGPEGQPLPGSIATGASFTLGTISLSGANLTTRWGHALEGGSNVVVQAYYDRTERTVPPTFAETLDIFDVQFQHSISLADSHAVVWGGEYRYSFDRLENSSFFAFLPASVDQRWASLFAQDETTLAKDLRLVLGARLERNDYTGNEFLPNARLAWKFAPDHLLWTAASRTVRAPSRLDRDAFVPRNPPPPPFLLAGGPDFRSEVAKVFEVGYRGQPATSISYSVTVFHADYDHLHTQDIAPSGTFLVFGNGMEGTTNGVEMWGNYQALRTWRLSAGLTGLRETLQLKPGTVDTANSVAQGGQNPAHSWMLRSSLDLPYQSEIDVTVRHVSALANPAVPAYTTGDLRYGWRPRRDLELSVTGQNLFGGEHAEFTAPATRSQLGRSVFFKVLGRF